MEAHGQGRKPERVVLIGAASFIGRALAKALGAERVPLLELTSAALDLTEPGADGRLAERLRPGDSVVMLAALTPDRGRDVATFMKNAAMMSTVCAALGKTRCVHLVYFSSDAVYDGGASRVGEDTPAAPQTLYGAMHLARELMAQSLGLPLLVLRPTGVYGAGDTHNAYGPNRFVRAARVGGTIALFGGGEEMRDHIHVDDLARLAVRCLLRGTTGTLNAATGRSLSFRDVAGIVARHVPADIASAARNSAVTHRHFDVTPLLKRFPDFSFTTIEDGIARMCAAAGEDRWQK